MKIFTLSYPVCLECDAVDEKCLMLVLDGQIQHQCCSCGSNRILWCIEEIEIDDEPSAHDLKKTVNDEEDLEDDPNECICQKCRAEGYGRE